MARALIPLADGVEEMEAVIVADTLRRARWEVVLAGLKPGVVTASRGVKLQPDTTWADIDPATFDILVLPGGAGGATHLASDSRVTEALHAFRAADKWIAAICAAPAVVLHAAGITLARRATCYPGMEAGLQGTDWQNERVVVDDQIVTSRGPGTSFEFALTLIRLIDGDEAANEVASGMLVSQG
ncbi:MAG: DJ-1/PfpI family protein [Kiritimatiellae bacterium]|nr:DJ-1/PfpI family protein [Kiritimatiellia bacterium]